MVLLLSHKRHSCHLIPDVRKRTSGRCGVGCICIMVARRLPETAAIRQKSLIPSVVDLVSQSLKRGLRYAHGASMRYLQELQHRSHGRFETSYEVLIDNGIRLDRPGIELTVNCILPC